MYSWRNQLHSPQTWHIAWSMRWKSTKSNLRLDSQVWSWDITYLRTVVRGLYYYLYVILDVWSRKIVGWAVHEWEDNELAAALIRETAGGEQVDPGSLVLHSDNRGPRRI